MATHVPQRELRNETAALLRRVQSGERLRITVHGHPVADLVPIEEAATFVPRERLNELRGLLVGDEMFLSDIRDIEDEAVDPFE